MIRRFVPGRAGREVGEPGVLSSSGQTHIGLDAFGSSDDGREEFDVAVPSGRVQQNSGALRGRIRKKLGIALLTAFTLALAACSGPASEGLAPSVSDSPAQGVPAAAVSPSVSDDGFIDVNDASSGAEVDPKEYDKYQAPPPEVETPGVKDRYQTDQVPAGKPKPVEPQDAVVDSGRTEHATLLIDVGNILKAMDQFNKDKLDVLPADGVVLAKTKISFSKGESVFDILLRETRARKIHMEYVDTPIYNSAYIEGIHNLYEFDCGELSGWMYNVNGWYPNYGASRYQVQDGDRIEWRYTCDLGRDLGQTWIG
jgi:hypothetical protein